MHRTWVKYRAPVGQRRVAGMPSPLDFLPTPGYPRRMHCGASRSSCWTRSPRSSWACSARCSAPTAPPTASPATTSRSARPDGRPVPHRAGFTFVPHADLAPIERADLVARARAPASATPAPPEVVAALRAAADRGAYVLSVCSGAFALGAAGLLDGRQLHHALAARRRAGPAATRRPRSTRTSLYVGDGRRADQRRHRRRHRPVPAPGPRRSTARRWPPRWPGGWSCRRTATAGRRSTSRRRCRAPRPGRPCSRCWRGLIEHLDRRLHRRASWPRGRTCRRAPSPAGSGPRPARPRTTG